MQTADLAQLKHDALDKIIFHMTPKQWLGASGAWVLERGEGALLYDADGREYLDAMSGGVFAVLAGYGREEIAQAMYDQARRLNYTSPYGTTSKVTIELARKLAALTPGRAVGVVFLQQRLGSRRGGGQARSPLPRSQRPGPPVQGRVTAPGVTRIDEGSPVGNRLEPSLPGLPAVGRPGRSRGRFHQRHAPLLPPVRAGADPPVLRPGLRHHDRTGDPGQ